MTQTNKVPANDERPQWLTIGEAAAILGASIATVRRMADNEVLTSVRVKSWSSRGVDALGRQLRGHRRVSRESVMKVKREQDAAQAAFEKPGS